MERWQRFGVTGALALAMLGAFAAAAAAQDAIGAGPLTQPLATTEPQTGVLRLGRARVAPGIVVQEIGWDSNVFDDAFDPQSDFIVSVIPDASTFMRLRFLQLSTYTGASFGYFRKYAGERANGYTLRGRLDLLASRFRPFISGAAIQQRQRPNGEIDVRANRRDDELSGGVAFDLSEHSQIYASANQFRTRYKNAVEDGVDLSIALNRDSQEYSGGVRTDLTPLLTVTLSGTYRQDRFQDPLRDGDHRLINASFRIAPEAVVTGGVAVAFQDYRGIGASTIEEFRGATGNGVISYSFLEVGRLTAMFNRSLEYSFSAEEALYLENTFTLLYTHRLFGAVDVQAKGGRSLFDYSFSEVAPPHTDRLDTYGASLGYNLRNRTRVALNYEYAERRSPILADRNYNRKRVFLSWTYAL